LVFSPKICPKTASFFIPAAAKPADWQASAAVKVGDVEKVLATVMVKLLKACF
jgi:hypothetical protein